MNPEVKAHQLIDHINLDQGTFSEFSEQAEAQAQTVIQTFVDYFKQNKDEIVAPVFFYQQAYQRRALTPEIIETLHEHLTKLSLLLTTSVCGVPMTACKRGK